MPRPRWTTRRIMAAVAALAAGLGLGLPAFEAACEPAAHSHSWYEWTDGTTALYQGFGECGMGYRSRVLDRYPFGRRYRRRLSGAAPPACDAPGPPCPGEACSLRPSP